MSGVTIGWDNATPAAGGLVGQGDDEIRSLKSNVQGAIAAEHLFPAAGGYAGVHALGSARVFVGTTSQVSSADTTGRLMWNSTTSQLVYVGAEGTAAIGGAGGVSVSSPTISATSRFVSFYTSITGNSWPTGPITTPFLSGSAPHYQATVSTDTASVGSILLGVGVSNSVPIPIVLAQGAGTSPQIFLLTSLGSTSTVTWTVNLFGMGFAAL